MVKKKSRGFSRKFRPLSRIKTKKRFSRREHGRHSSLAMPDLISAVSKTSDVETGMPATELYQINGSVNEESTSVSPEYESRQSKTPGLEADNPFNISREFTEADGLHSSDAKRPSSDTRVAENGNQSSDSTNSTSTVEGDETRRGNSPLPPMVCLAQEEEEEEPEEGSELHDPRRDPFTVRDMDQDATPRNLTNHLPTMHRSRKLDAGMGMMAARSEVNRGVKRSSYDPDEGSDDLFNEGKAIGSVCYLKKKILVCVSLSNLSERTSI